MRKNELLERIREAGYPHVAYRIETNWKEPSIKEIFNEIFYEHQRHPLPKDVFLCSLTLYGKIKQIL